jgi:hypothetical protein
MNLNLTDLKLIALVAAVIVILAVRSRSSPRFVERKLKP